MRGLTPKFEKRVNCRGIDDYWAMDYSRKRGREAYHMINEKQLIPVDAYWMDPNALYRKSAPFDSASLKALPENQKQVPIPYMLSGGEIVPADTKVIWPYSCSQQ